MKALDARESHAIPIGNVEFCKVTVHAYNIAEERHITLLGHIANGKLSCYIVLLNS